MTKAVQIAQHGGPEQLKVVDVTVGDPGPGEIRIRHHAVGLNFIDVYHRTGVYPLPMPATIGMEGAGIVEAVGAGVAHLQPGDRAAYASQPPGAYCEVRVMPAKCVVKLPRRHQLRDGCGHDAQGSDGAIPAAQDPAGAGACRPAISCCSTRLQAAWGLIACQWARALGLQLIGHGGLGRQMRAGQGAWRRPCHQLRH